MKCYKQPRFIAMAEALLGVLFSLGLHAYQTGGEVDNRELIT